MDILEIKSKNKKSVDDISIGLITLALATYADQDKHDKESGIITIKAYQSPWSMKFLGLNRGINRK